MAFFLCIFGSVLKMKKMNKNLVLVILIMTVFSVKTYSQTSVSGAVLSFEKEYHDYGKIDIENIPEAKLTIKFFNKGNQPLVVSNVRGCCGTRVIDWTKEPIMPGKSGTVKIEFEILPKIQTINRTVTVMSNSVNSPDIYKIKGEVVEIDKSIIKK